MSTFTLASPAFEEGSMIPPHYTCDGENINSPLRWEGAPKGTASFALLVDDPDIPPEVKERFGIEKWDHWVLYNIAPGTTSLEEGEAPGEEGLNSSGTTGYQGPCPPPQYEPKEHRYVFRLLALDTMLSVPAAEAPTYEAIEKLAEEHVLAEARLTGRYRRE